MRLFFLLVCFTSTQAVITPITLPTLQQQLRTTQEKLDSIILKMDTEKEKNGCSKKWLSYQKKCMLLFQRYKTLVERQHNETNSNNTP